MAERRLLREVQEDSPKAKRKILDDGDERDLNPSTEDNAPDAKKKDRLLG